MIKVNIFIRIESYCQCLIFPFTYLGVKTNIYLKFIFALQMKAASLSEQKATFPEIRGKILQCIYLIHFSEEQQ